MSYKIPLIVMYNPLSQQVVIGLIKRREETNDGQEEENYIRSIEPESRHPQIFNMAKEAQIFVEEIFSMGVQAAPTKVLISKGLTNPYELNISMLHHQARKLEILQCDIR